MYQRSPACSSIRPKHSAAGVVLEGGEPPLELPLHGLGVGLVGREHVLVGDPALRSGRRIASRHSCASRKRARSSATSGWGMRETLLKRARPGSAIFGHPPGLCLHDL